MIDETGKAYCSRSTCRTVVGTDYAGICGGIRVVTARAGRIAKIDEYIRGNHGATCTVRGRLRARQAIAGTGVTDKTSIGICRVIASNKASILRKVLLVGNKALETSSCIARETLRDNSSTTSARKCARKAVPRIGSRSIDYIVISIVAGNGEESGG